MTTYKSEHLELIMTLISTTNEAAAAERTSGQAEIDAIQTQIEALEADLVGLPGQAKALRNQGFVRQSRELTEQVEELNIRIARLVVERAQLEADRQAKASKKASSVVQEIAKIAGEGMLEAEQAAQQARHAFNELQFQAQNINMMVWGNYGQPAAEANKRLKEAQDRLNKAINGVAVPAA